MINFEENWKRNLEIFPYKCDLENNYYLYIEEKKKILILNNNLDD